MNIKDIAQLSGVSTATVSRVINNKPGVKKEIREKIELLLSENDYKPNLIARRLVQKKSNTIGVLIPQVNSFYTGRIEGVFEVATKYGYSVMIGSRIKSSINEVENFRMFYENQVDGIIYFASRVRDEMIEEIKKISNTIPIVLVDQEEASLDIPFILQDNYSGAAKIMEHLISKGHKAIAYIHGYEGDKAVKLRFKAYTEILTKYGIEIKEEYIGHGNFSPITGYNEAKKIMEASLIKPTAIFSANDGMAIGAIKYLTEKGYRIPEDIAVCGYDDIELADYIIPALTTIRQDHKGTGIEAAELIINYINTGKYRTKKIIMNNELIVRQST